ncbi:MAG: type II toxin-antitoxin system RelE/ParE family toxin [Thermoanaerobaculia bacterium]
MKVRWSPLAIDRAAEAARFIAADDPSAAARWVDELFLAVSKLERHSSLGKAVPELNRPPIRQIVYRSRRVIYRIGASALHILTVRHTRRRFDPEEVGER